MICEWQQGLQQATVAAHPINNIHTPKLSSVINLSIPDSSHIRDGNDRRILIPWTTRKNVSYPGKLAKYHCQYSIPKLALVSVSIQHKSHSITFCKHEEFSSGTYFKKKARAMQEERLFSPQMYSNRHHLFQPRPEKSTKQISKKCSDNGRSWVKSP